MIKDCNKMKILLSSMKLELLGLLVNIHIQ